MIDPQSSQITPDFAIDAAGVSRLHYPFVVAGSASAPQQTASGCWTIAAKVASTERGTHMSRMLQALEEVRQKPLDIFALQDFARQLLTLLESTQITIQTEFIWFAPVQAPVTGATALLDHQVRFGVRAGEQEQATIFMEVAAKSVCPCSKAISERGAHNQRSLISADIELAVGQQSLDLSALSHLLQHAASSPVYPILKRADEKHVTEQAFDHPVFVEDIARNVANKLADLSAVAAFTVHVRNLESIHSHDCFATIRYPLTQPTGP